VVYSGHCRFSRLVLESALAASRTLLLLSLTKQLRSMAAVALLGLAIFVSALASSQTATPLTLEQMSSRAATIFAGRVVDIKAIRSPDGTLATMKVSFCVNHAIRGVRDGDIIKINEWPGLWQSSSSRYRVGEQVVLFLYAPCRAGLTSPVGGELGRIAMDQTGNVFMTASQAQMWSRPWPDRSRPPRIFPIRDIMSRMHAINAIRFYDEK
jgi:hypothetical protein